MTDNGQFTLLRYKCVQYKYYTATEIMMLITNLEKKVNKQSAQNGTHLLKLKMEIRNKSKTMQQRHTNGSIHF